jgi:hypothetical protein
MHELTPELREKFMAGFAETGRIDDGLNALLAHLPQDRIETPADHAYREYNAYGNSCHFPGCTKITNGDHRPGEERPQRAPLSPAEPAELTSGSEEPAFGTKVRDRAGDVWTRGLRGWELTEYRGRVPNVSTNESWTLVTNTWGPLTLVTDK